MELVICEILFTNLCCSRNDFYILRLTKPFLTNTKEGRFGKRLQDFNRIQKVHLIIVFHTLCFSMMIVQMAVSLIISIRV